ncbi:MAG: cytochrome C oxidase subunit IV family protein [Salibacteraceae bacterium]
MERDDIIEYSLDAHHSEDEGRKIRKKIIFVTALLTIVTAVEVGLGIIASGWVGVKWELVKWSFIVMTLVKAGYIVMVFMHLGDERKALRWLILAPYAMFILYLSFICLTEALAIADGVNETGIGQ